MQGLQNMSTGDILALILRGKQPLNWQVYYKTGIYFFPIFLSLITIAFILFFWNLGNGLNMLYLPPIIIFFALTLLSARIHGKRSGTFLILLPDGVVKFEDIGNGKTSLILPFSAVDHLAYSTKQTTRATPAMARTWTTFYLDIYYKDGQMGRQVIGDQYNDPAQMVRSIVWNFEMWQANPSGQTSTVQQVLNVQDSTKQASAFFSFPAVSQRNSRIAMSLFSVFLIFIAVFSGMWFYLFPGPGMTSLYPVTFSLGLKDSSQGASLSTQTSSCIAHPQVEVAAVIVHNRTFELDMNMSDFPYNMTTSDIENIDLPSVTAHVTTGLFMISTATYDAQEGARDGDTFTASFNVIPHPGELWGLAIMSGDGCEYHPLYLQF